MMVGSSGANGESGFSQRRWPRQETLTLLEIRTRLHPKFQQASVQKAPLWDEVSRYKHKRKKKKKNLHSICFSEFKNFRHINVILEPI